MTDLQIHFIPDAEIDPDLQMEIDGLDKLAFEPERLEDDPELSGITWAPSEWMALGRAGGVLITQLGLLKREILAGGERVWVAGVGGVATHPQYQKKGHGLALLRAATPFMRNIIQVPFGLLICGDETRYFYERAGWQAAADNVLFAQETGERSLNACVMILPLGKQAWRAGKIDLCGMPW